MSDYGDLVYGLTGGHPVSIPVSDPAGVKTTPDDPDRPGPTWPRMGIAPTPMVWPETTEKALLLTQEESNLQGRNLVKRCKSGTCGTTLQIGVFFDGTNNNRERDEPDRSHTNIVRLFNAHPDAVTGKGDLYLPGFYRYYIPGVGTAFPENQEWRESSGGKAQGDGAFERVIFGVFSVFNAIHRYLQKDQVLYDTPYITHNIKNFLPILFKFAHEKLTPFVKAANQEAGGLGLRAVRVNVFGFSRGAAEAVAFCHYMNMAFPQQSIAGVPLYIHFLGLIDCVTSMGIADSSRRLDTPALKSTGHGSRADVGTWPTHTLPSIVRQAVHLVSAHEQRMNFPVDLVEGANMQTFIYPGVHSDLGGGYGTNSQGRSPSEGMMLSQLPLMHMHKLATINAVKLATHKQISADPILSKDFALDGRLAGAWNAYMKATNADFIQSAIQAKKSPQSLSTCKDAGTLIQQHMRMRYDQLRRYREYEMLFDQRLLAPLSAQDNEDIRSSVHILLYADLYLTRPYVKVRRGIIPLSREDQATFNNYRSKANLAVQLLCKQTMGDSFVRRSVFKNVTKVDLTWPIPEDLPWIDWGIDQMCSNASVTRVKENAHMELMHQYVHDSMAGFYMVGYTTAAEKSEALQKMVEKRKAGEELSAHETTVLKNYDEKIKTDSKLMGIIQDHIKARARVSPADYDKLYAYKREEANHVAESGVFPVLRDEDEPILLSTQPLTNRAVVPLVTSTRREGGGYLFPRAVFVRGKPIGLIG